MSTARRPQDHADDEARSVPAIAVCETRPGRAVFLESNNDDGWIASDTIVDVQR
ncbi:hypothetical protein [Halopiger goleimassiliensis]|uniref:hypothetical protein n=1 Tax=Halopiger goleimassiliensis TaxID=1293048 RepID=UPI0018A7F62A|nr:hypothetical protein [Halopiger goleimassiliensis]